MWHTRVVLKSRPGGGGGGVEYLGGMEVSLVEPHGRPPPC